MPQRYTLKGGVRTNDRRLDRIASPFDRRTLDYPVDGALNEDQREPISHTWPIPDGTPVLNQGVEGACVGMGVTNELLYYPVAVRGLDEKFAREKIYWVAQREDPWAGGSYPGASPRYEGTSVLFGVKAAADLGYYTEYRWATTEKELALGVGYLGPAIIGVDWYEGMFRPDDNGFIHPNGEKMGGHCCLLYGINVRDGHYKLRNSWGPDWGTNGSCKITRADVAKLLKDNGEACIITRRTLPPPAKREAAAKADAIGELTVTDTLALKFRPRTFEDLVGQPAVQIVLKPMVKTGRVPSALLFDGCRGTGKTTTARILAAALNCTADTRPCGTCTNCTDTFNGTSLDVLEIDAASNGLVDDIRALRQQIRYRQQGDYRIVILDEAQSISPAGFNALLKTLEEPPPNTTFILLTTEPHKIPETIASRCMPFTFNRLTPNDIAARLAHIATAEHRRAEPCLLTLIADKADGAMRDAIMLLDQVTRVGMTTADQYQRLIGHHDHAPTILERIANKDILGAYTTLDKALTRVADPAVIVADAISCLRDVLVLRLGGEITKTGTALAARQNLALALPTPAVVGFMKILWQVKTQLRTDDARSTLELAVVLLSEVSNTSTGVHA